MLIFSYFLNTVDPWTKQVWIMWVHLYKKFFCSVLKTWELHNQHLAGSTDAELGVKRSLAHDVCVCSVAQWATRALQVAPMVKNPPANAGDTRGTGSTPGSGRFSGGRNGNPLQCSCWGKSHRHRSLAGYSPWGRKRVGCNCATEHSDTTKVTCMEGWL